MIVLALDTKIKMLDNCIAALREAEELPLEFREVHIMLFNLIKQDLMKLSKIQQQEKFKEVDDFVDKLNKAFAKEVLKKK